MIIKSNYAFASYRFVSISDIKGAEITLNCLNNVGLGVEERKTTCSIEYGINNNNFVVGFNDIILAGSAVQGTETISL